jgi:hypothetical protein
VRAYDDGSRVYIEFPAGIAQAEMPPLFVVGGDGRSAELVNYRVRGRHMIVDRLFGAAELRSVPNAGSNASGSSVTTGARIVTDRPAAPEVSPESDPPRTERESADELRLRPTLPGVTRLSRKVLIGLGRSSASIGVGGALMLGLQSRDSGGGPSELYNTDRVAQADGLG